MALPKHFSLAKTLKLLKVRILREKMPNSPTLPFSKSPKTPLAKKAVKYVFIGVMNSVLALSVAEDTPPSLKYSAEVDDGPISPKPSNDEDFVYFALNPYDKAWSENVTDLADLDA